VEYCRPSSLADNPKVTPLHLVLASPLLRAAIVAIIKGVMSAVEGRRDAEFFESDAKLESTASTV
jgi:hypothetical protein